LFKTLTFSKPLHVLGLPFKNHKKFCHFDATLAIDRKAYNKMKGGGSQIWVVVCFMSLVPMVH